MMLNMRHLPITPIIKIQYFSLGTLILRQKSFQFCNPRQPVLPYWLINCNEYFLVKSIWRNWPAKLGNWRKCSTSGLPSGGTRSSNWSKTNQRSHKWNKLYCWYLMPTDWKKRSFKWKFVRNFWQGGKSCQKTIWVNWHKINNDWKFYHRNRLYLGQLEQNEISSDSTNCV